MSATASRATRLRAPASLAAVVVSLLLVGLARAETATPAPATETPPGTPSFLELAERLRGVGSFSECAVEALRDAYD